MKNIINVTLQIIGVIVVIGGLLILCGVISLDPIIGSFGIFGGSLTAGTSKTINERLNSAREIEERIKILEEEKEERQTEGKSLQELADLGKELLNNEKTDNTD